MMDLIMAILYFIGGFTFIGVVVFIGVLIFIWGDKPNNPDLNPDNFVLRYGRLWHKDTKENRERARNGWSSRWDGEKWVD